MEIEATINTIDAWRILRAELARRTGCEVKSITVQSWNATVCTLDDNFVQVGRHEGIRHHMRPEHATLLTGDDLV